MNTGEALKKELGLSKFTFVTIQKVMGLSLPVFIVTFDSKHPTIYIPYSRLLKLKFATLKQIISSKPKTVMSDTQFKSKKVKMTPPFEIENYSKIIPTRSLIFTRDLAGEWYRNAKLYECVDGKIRKIDV